MLRKSLLYFFSGLMIAAIFPQLGALIWAVGIYHVLRYRRLTRYGRRNHNRMYTYYND